MLDVQYKNVWPFIGHVIVWSLVGMEVYFMEA